MDQSAPERALHARLRPGNLLFAHRRQCEHSRRPQSQAGQPQGRDTPGRFRLGRGEPQSTGLDDPFQQGNRWVKNWVGPVLAAPATIWLLAAFVAPFLIVALLSVQPESDPFAPLASSFSCEQFKEIFADKFYLLVILMTAVLHL